MATAHRPWAWARSGVLNTSSSGLTKTCAQSGTPGPEVGELLEALAHLAPAAPVRSLKEGSRAHAVRSPRTCYDHLAGQLGTAVMDGLLARGVLAGGDGTFDAPTRDRDRLSSAGWDCDYRLTESGEAGWTSSG